jgi:hypothetical protein
VHCLGLHGVVLRDTLEAQERICVPVTTLGSCHQESCGGIEDESSIVQIDGKRNGLETIPGRGWLWPSCGQRLQAALITQQWRTRSTARGTKPAF